MPVKNRLKEILDERDTNYSKFATRAGVDRGTLNNIMNGRHAASLENALKIAKGLNMKVDDIFELEEIAENSKQND